MILQIIFIVLGLLLLLGGGDYFVKASCSVATALKISPLIIGLTIVAFGTSAPELFVTCGAALKGNADFSIGNIVGSNLFNILCVIGVSAILTPLVINKQVIHREMPIMIIAMLLFYIFSFDGNITQFEGGLLFLCILLYIFSIYLKSKQQDFLEQDELPQVQWSIPVSVVIIIFGISAMVLGANWIIDNASALAADVGISDFVISATLAAVGTSLPELATTIAAARHKQADLIIGNAVGSNIFNVFSVIGLTALISPLSVAQEVLSFDYLYMLGVCFFVLALMYFRKTFSRLEALILISVYAIYMVCLFT